MRTLIKILITTLFIALFTLTITCNGGEMANEKIHFNNVKDIPASSWEKLSQKKIYFGHQSVGNNILDGIKDLMKENQQIKIDIRELSNNIDFRSGFFMHSRVGKNEDPLSKIEAFKSLMQQELAGNVDIAFFKFCFVDITDRSDVTALFSEYKNTLSLLKKDYPEVVFIYTTVPLLKKTKSSFKSFIKRLLGRGEDFFNDAHNIKRNQFNGMLLEEYQSKEPIFDIAKIESTFLNGSRCSFNLNGKTYYSLVPEYTNDGGHLNEKGRKIVAEQLLILLMNIN